MIVRAILDNPELIEKFDWFNDGDNTINWLKWMRNNSEMVQKYGKKTFDSLIKNMMRRLNKFGKEYAAELSAESNKKLAQKRLRELLKNNTKPVLRYSINIYNAEEGGLWAEVTNMPGCATQGKSLEDLFINLNEAITGCEEAAK
jgi:tRNA-dihydrouridine synthase